MHSTATRPRFQATPKTGQQTYYSQVPEWVTDHAELSDGAVRCYSVLARYAGKNRKVYPSQDTLATRMKKSSRTIRGYLTELIKAGALVLSDERRRWNGVRVYFLLFEPPQEHIEPVENLVTQPTQAEKSDHPSGSFQPTNQSHQTNIYTPYIPQKGDLKSKSRKFTIRKDRKPRNNARRSESFKVQCPCCQAKPGEYCIGKNRKGTKRTEFHSERGAIAELWATEHLTVSGLTDHCFTCDGDGRIINESNVVQPCWSCRS